MWRRACALGIVIWLALGGILCASAHSESLKPSDKQPRSAGYGLWRVLPTKAFAVLGEGQVADLRWGIYAFRGRGSQGGARPCIGEVDLWRDGGFSQATECGYAAPPPNWPTFTLTSTSVKRSGSPPIEGSVIGMTFATSVRRARIDLGPGPSVIRRTRLLSAKQAEKAHIEPFRYLAFDIGRTVCLEGVTGYDSSDVAVLDTTRYKCSGPEIVVPHS